MHHCGCLYRIVYSVTYSLKACILACSVFVIHVFTDKYSVIRAIEDL